jgi:hypothetical protein
MELGRSSGFSSKGKRTFWLEPSGCDLNTQSIKVKFTSMDKEKLIKLIEYWMQDLKMNGNSKHGY